MKPKKSVIKRMERIAKINKAKITKKKEISPYIKLAIENEKKLIECRKAQIKNYKLKLKLLESGMRMSEINDKIKPIRTRDFVGKMGDYIKEYNKLKEEWENENRNI